MAEVEEHLLPGGMTYAIKPDHRNQAPLKSQWQITQPEELATFRLGVEQSWFVEDRGWGLHLVGAKAQNLGVAQDRSRLLFVARFEGDLLRQYWHGYPADHLRRSDDIPAESIARSWIVLGFVPASKVRKLLNGQPCSL